jgi:hypothetical protein
LIIYKVQKKSKNQYQSQIKTSKYTKSNNYKPKSQMKTQNPIMALFIMLAFFSCKKANETKSENYTNHQIESVEVDKNGNTLKIIFNQNNTAVLELYGKTINLQLDTTMSSGANYKNDHYQYTNWHHLTTVEKDGKIIFQSGKETIPSIIESKHFEGTYLAGKKSDYWVTVKIEKLDIQDRYAIMITSKEIKEQQTCQFNKTGYLNNDTIFIKITDWKRPVTAIITKKNKTISIDVIKKLSDDQFALMYYCNGGASLIGKYTAE